MSVFHFQRFDVRNDLSAMKVNTDGVLLGAVTDVFPEDRSVLDIGTGTGTIALMLAQRLGDLSDNFLVHAIDIDEPSAAEASANFVDSPWNSSLRAFRMGLKEFSMPDSPGEAAYDLVVSNPPYFDSSLKAPSERRNNARHVGDPEDGTGVEVLSYREVLEYSMSHLRPGGRVAVVLPSDQEKALLRHARMCGFAPWKILRVKSVPRKAVSRIIVQFRRKGECLEAVEEEISIMDEKGRHTLQYISLVKDYLLSSTFSR